MSILSSTQPQVKLCDADIRTLAYLEYDFIAIDSQLGDMLARLTLVSIPEAQTACEEVSKLRYALRSVLHKLDAPVTEAIRLAEAGQEPPF